MKILLALLFAFPALAATPNLPFPKLKNPIVLVHGATMKGSSLDVGPFHFGPYFQGLPEYLGGSGTPVKLVELTTDSSIGERGAVLKNFLETELRGQKVNLICHSLGGLDARYAASILRSDQILSITTIGTPHLGSPLANWAVDQMHGRTAWYWFFRLIGYDMQQRRFLPELSTAYMANTFNPKVPDRKNIRYFSVQTKASFAEKNMSYMLWFTARWLERQNHPLSKNGHDGLVPFDSQAWGKVITQARIDHLAQINHHEWRGLDQSALVYETYGKIYENLAKEGL